MEIVRRSYELQWQAILFEVVDENDRFVCGISLEALDPDRGGMISGEEGLQLFDDQAANILQSASLAVTNAKEAGVRHIACQRNEPIFVGLDGQL